MKLGNALGKYVVVKEHPVEDKKTSSGLVLTEKHQDNIRYKKGTIVSPGTNVDSVKEGDTVLFDSNAGFRMDFGEDDWRVILEHDLVYVL